MNISKFDLILTSWPSYLTFDLEKLYTSVSAKDTYVGQVWWWYVKAFVSYRRTHRQTDKHTNERAIGDCVLAKISKNDAQSDDDYDINVDN